MRPWSHASSLVRLERAAPVPSGGGRVLLLDPGGHLAMTDGHPRTETEPSPDDWCLGMIDDQLWFARLLPDRPADGVSLREVWGGSKASWVDAAVAAAALAAWHGAEPACPGCGAATRVTARGWARRCESCGREHFPRHDPAVIVAILDDDGRLLLGHQHSWLAGRYSLLAGFVEAGESLEEALHREVGEEVGLAVDDLCYLGSQPWPFPRSLMCAFAARAVDDDIAVDGEEITDARFFSRAQLARVLETGAVSRPTGASVSAAVVTAWLESSARTPAELAAAVAARQDQRYQP